MPGVTVALEGRGGSASRFGMWAYKTFWWISHGMEVNKDRLLQTRVENISKCHSLGPQRVSLLRYEIECLCYALFSKSMNRSLFLLFSNSHRCGR